MPTTDLTRIHCDDKFFVSPSYQLSKSINSIVSGYNMYITSDVKFKINEWITDGIGVIKSTPKLVDAQGLVNRRDWKKIILTTDRTLIKEGVSDLFFTNTKFVEWFVEHPDTEWVNVIPLMSNNGRALFGYDVEKIEGLANMRCSCMRYTPGDFTSNCRICGLPPKTTPTPVTFTWEEVKRIAEWSFHFHKRNDLNDDELETEWKTLLNKMYEKKLL